jgi:hypothetical protein
MFDNIIDCVLIWDILVFILGILFSVFSTIIIIRFYRPTINIGVPIIASKRIKIPIKNSNKKKGASNIKIEVSGVLNDFTYHLKCDRYEFLLLPRYEINKLDKPYERIFHALDVDDYTKEITEDCNNLNEFLDILKNEKAFLRVRVHANHEFTGFGRAFEAKFKLKNDKFELVYK